MSKVDTSSWTVFGGIDGCSTWHIVEQLAYGAEVCDNITLKMNDEAINTLADYIVETHRRVISLKQLWALLPDVYDTIEQDMMADEDMDDDDDLDFDILEDDDEEDIQPFFYIHDHHPDIMRTRGLLLQDDVLIRAFDRMPKDEYAPEDDALKNHLGDEYHELFDHPAPDHLVWSSLYSHTNDGWQPMDVTCTIEPNGEEFNKLVDWVVKHHDRHISLLELNSLCPGLLDYMELYHAKDDVAPSDYPESRMAEEYVGLEDEVLAAAFDIIYCNHITY